MKHKKTLKNNFHPRSKHQNAYCFNDLIKIYPTLEPFLFKNKMGKESIDFFNPIAVKALNKALLLHHYNLKNWNIPDGYLCPPIPGRADYLHYVADLLTKSNNNKIIKGANILCLDIGVGANCIYPLVGSSVYNWNFIGSDINKKALIIAQQNIDYNNDLKNKIELRFQQNKKNVYKGIITENEFIDITICNPPFHSSAKEAEEGSIRKLQNLKKEKVTKASLNFGGQENELWYKGGEIAFVQNMINESNFFANSCFWFTCLISKQKNLNSVYNSLKKAGALEIETISMQQGNKNSRILAWTFLSKDLQKKWTQFKWQ